MQGEGFWGHLVERKKMISSFPGIVRSWYGPGIKRLRTILGGKGSQILTMGMLDLKGLICLQDLTEKGRNQTAGGHEVWCGAWHASEKELYTVWATEMLMSCLFFFWTPGAGRDSKPCYGTRFLLTVSHIFAFVYYKCMDLFMLKKATMFCLFYPHGWLVIWASTNIIHPTW